MNDSGLNRSLRQVFLVPILTVLLGAAALYFQIQHANRTVDLMQASAIGVTRAAVTERLIVDQETGLRGYQTTGSALFLSSYNDAAPQLGPALTQLRSSVARDTARAALVDQLHTTHDAWEQGFAVPLIATIQAGGRADDVQLNLQGKAQMDQMRGLLAQIQRLEEGQRTERVARWHAQVRSTTVGLALFALVIGTLIGTHAGSLIQTISAAFQSSAAILRQRADEAFRSEQRLRITLASIGEAVITCDAEGRIQTMNEVAVRLTGLPETEAVGHPLQHVLQVLSPETRAPRPELFAEPALRPSAAGPEDAEALPAAGGTVDGLVLRQDGSEILIEESDSVLRDRHGVITGHVLVLRDVTVARKSQAALLANEKLAVAGRLAASIAHEIHNPLDAVSNLLYLMDGVSSPEENLQFLELARGEIARVTQISRAMLSLHRESARPVPLDLKEMLLSVLLLLERRFTDLGVTAVPDLPDEIVITAFPAELRQVFTNLLLNAAEASPRGASVRLAAARTLTYRRSGCQRAEPGVCITVQDAGSGIQEQTRARLFEPFVTTKGESGTGLGLWISKGILTKHGGEILLETSTAEADHGTTVTVFLPERAGISSV